ncbi:RNA polymerase sigma-70 factor [Arenibacter sp. 6A1]|uniref:RNA polymerase sigma factor n=1 Tax=Arenibacter sp. 6A1 TaxID=2720391 RepID=UPI0014466326|nr:RNA polymerase sigma-70 factor [Arenibacter sp. 6A1]NKI25455.1 RNA polymerase sigma-70 factor [Arenibacter sp. 6A1]
MKALKKGDTQAFRAVFDIYQNRVYHFVKSITKSDYVSEEIVQEVFIKIWGIKESINTAHSFEAFLFTIARNATYNYLRSVANQQSLKEEFWKNISYSNKQTEDTILLGEYEALVENILENIPPQKRNIFILSKQQGKSHQEIADLLGISTKTVKNHLWETLKILKSQLKPHLETIHFLLVFLLL